MSSAKKSHKENYKEKLARKKEEKPEEPETPRYRDRAKERREDVNPDYEPTELGPFHAVAPPGTVDLRANDAHKLSIEHSKYLGGDVEHTHLVKGLDYALLNKVRSEIDKKPDDEDEKDGKPRVPVDDKPVTFRTATAKSVYQWMVKPQSMIKANEMFLPGRMAFIFNTDDGFSHDIPTTVHRSKADCPVPEEMVTVSVDGSVLERIAKIMSYLRLGSSGKVLKKKRKEKDIKGKFSNGFDDHEKPVKSDTGITSHRSERELMPPPPPPSRKSHVDARENQPPPVARLEEEDIFVGEGVNYSIPDKEMSHSPVSEDMEESPRNRERQPYFSEPVYGPVPPSEAVYGPVPPSEAVYGPVPPSETAQAWPQGNGYDAAIQAQMVAAGYQGDWQQYQYAEQLAYQEQYIQQNIQDYDALATMELDQGMMTQEDKDRGLGSVFKRDDQRLQQLREKDAREKDPTFISDSYSECYPGYQEYNRELQGSDDEEDLSKMDMGGRAKGRLHRWDFESEEEWATYNEQKEAMPKAAFQFGVKMQDGRKTRKQNKDQKLTNELHKINKIIARKKGDKDGGNDDDGWQDEDAHPGKKLRI